MLMMSMVSMGLLVRMGSPVLSHSNLSCSDSSLSKIIDEGGTNMFAVRELVL